MNSNKHTFYVLYLMMCDQNLLMENIALDENENITKRINNKRKNSDISYEIRLENMKPFRFYRSFEEEENDIHAKCPNQMGEINYYIKLMPVNAIFEYKHMIYKLIMYNNSTENVVVQLLKDGLLNKEKILAGQVIELCGSFIGHRLFNYEYNN